MTRNRLGLIALIVVALVGFSYYGATNFDRIVLGEGNFGTDPNTTADITFQNDEYISNSTDGTLDIGSANLTTTGTATITTLSPTTLTLGNLFSFGARDSVRLQGVLDTLPLTGLGNIICIRSPNQDTVEVITGGVTGTMYIFQAAYDDSTVFIADGGNIKASGLLTLDAATDRVMFFYDGTNFTQLTAVQSND